MSVQVERLVPSSNKVCQPIVYHRWYHKDIRAFINIKSLDSCQFVGGQKKKDSYKFLQKLQSTLSCQS